MSFLEAVDEFGIHIATIGGIAINKDGSLIASVDKEAHCLRIHQIGVCGTVIEAVRFDTRGDGNFGIWYPYDVCFASRANGVETVLVCDSYDNCVLEVSTTGEFRRFTSFEENDVVHGIAYCPLHDIVALSFCNENKVLLLDYATMMVKTTIRSGEALSVPAGLAFTPAGDRLIVGDSGLNRIGMYDSCTGACIAHVSTDLLRPYQVVVCTDNSVIVADQYKSTLLRVWFDGCTSPELISPVHSDDTSVIVFAVASSPCFDGIFVKPHGGSVLKLKDAWSYSCRSDWLSACIL